jgi:glycosidase
MSEPQHRIREHLAFLYGQQQAEQLWPQVRRIITSFSAPSAPPLTERDAILITYGDQVTEPGVPPLLTLGDFLADHAAGVVSGVHLLPFFPYSSDDGFSVIDYKSVNPRFGTWDHVERIGRQFRLMFDAVINHISRESAWFQAFLQDDPQYRDYFITVPPGTDLSEVVRPRARALLTAVQTPSGKKLVWTTFSDDQIDLNFANPEVLLEILDVLRYYVARGAEIIRLDAIAYLWKIPGTSCIHLQQTHRVVQLFRAVLDAAAPGVKLITETNVPHQENVSYFGDGTNEAQLVYQFPLAPLVMDAVLTGRATHLSRWASQLELPSNQVTFFNFTASHDGIGVMPARGILSEDEIQYLVDCTRAHGGYVSYKKNADGTESVYELNISYFDALSDPDADEPLQRQIARFLLSQAIMLALQGVPGVYVHSLLGSRSWREGVARTGRPRTINRQKLGRQRLETDLADPHSLRQQVFSAYAHLLRQRSAHPAFHPQGAQEVVSDNESLFILRRQSAGRRRSLLALHNVSGDSQACHRPLGELFGPRQRPRAPLVDLISAQRYPSPEQTALTLRPYQAAWIAEP